MQFGKLLLLLFFLIPVLPQVTFSQKGVTQAYLSGQVVDLGGNAVPFVDVYLENGHRKTETDHHGNYKLPIWYSPGKKILVNYTKLGHEATKRIVELKSNVYEYTENVIFIEKSNELSEVVVQAKTAIQNVRESAFNVVALDAKSQYNSTLDLGHMLDKASGIKVRESGGVGSDMNISLNGFTGRHVKVFMDGVPMQGFGSAFQLNNIPVSVAERIEVYKGVVPIEFGADAIGGVINIVTNQTTNSFLDASYSYGSFNTHRTNVILGHTTKKGFSFQLNAYQNYSDNNYKIKSKILQANGQYTRDEIWVKRFHDNYHNEAIVGKVGVVGKSWADRMFLGLTLGQQNKDVQNSSRIQFVYGARTTSGKTVLPSFEYYKKNLIVNGLSVRLTANYNFNSNKNIDTTTAKYDWYGNILRYTNSRGEVGVNTLSEYNNSNYSTTANINYQINDKHSVAFNNVMSGSERRMSSSVPLDEVTAMDTLRRVNMKNVLGVSYRYRHSRNWNMNLFAKNYYQKVIGPFNNGDEAHPDYLEQKVSYSTSGYGIASTYFWKDYQFKGSIERTYRLPTDTELFGDEVLETANATLKAENSMNYNVGATLNREFTDKSTLYLDVNGYYRNTKDYIRRVQEQRFGTMGNVNHGQVRTIGLDVEGRYYYNNKIMLGGAVSYLDMRNQEKLRQSTGSALSGTYKDRMPNIPYFFGNVDAAYYVHKFFGSKNVLNLNYTFNFIGEYYLLWESQGDPSTKATLPQQLSHDLSATYVMNQGKYNFTLEAKNFTNTLLYDNFSLMKPGRAFYVKFRYYIMKRSKR
jgi:outer membrane receptor protein involved in Fe transport